MHIIFGTCSIIYKYENPLRNKIKSSRMKNEIGKTGDSRNGSDDGGGEAAKAFSIYNITA